MPFGRSSVVGHASVTTDVGRPLERSRPPTPIPVEPWNEHGPGVRGLTLMRPVWFGVAAPREDDARDTRPDPQASPAALGSLVLLGAPVDVMRST